jgi:TatD DNase family protein
MAVWVDTHCHLNEASFTPDLPAVIAEAESAGVRQMLVIGTTLASSRRAVEIATEFPAVFAVVGIQPNYVLAAEPGDWDGIVELAAHPRVVGIGETGLDRYWDHAPFELQREYFLRHIDLAHRLGRPFVVHCREAEVDVLQVLQECRARYELRGVMHSFCGSAEVAAAAMGYGLLISFAGMLTFKRNQPLRDVAATIPADALLLETDAPYLAPGPHRGKRNQPAYLVHTAECLATSRGVSLEELGQATTANARRLFGLPDLG